MRLTLGILGRSGALLRSVSATSAMDDGGWKTNGKTFRKWPSVIDILIENGSCRLLFLNEKTKTKKHGCIVVKSCTGVEPESFGDWRRF